MVRLAREARKEAVVRGHETRLIAPTLSSDPERGLRRREFLTFLGGAWVAPLVWPDDALAQQPRNVPTIRLPRHDDADNLERERRRVPDRPRELGWIDGRDVRDRIPLAGRARRPLRRLAADLRSARSMSSSRQAPRLSWPSRKRRPRTDRVAAAGDPVRTGLVASLARPGGNVTGLSNLATDSAAADSNC